MHINTKDWLNADILRFHSHAYCDKKYLDISNYNWLSPKIQHFKMMAEENVNQNSFSRPGWCGSVDWALACELKGHWFDSGSGHMPGLQVGSLHLAQWGRARSNQLIFLSHITVSLPLFLPLFPSYLKPATSPAGIIFLDLLNLTPIMVARKKAVTEKQTNAWKGVSNTLSMLACGEKKGVISAF